MALAKRIIPVLLSKRGTLVKGRCFSHGRVVGHALQAVRIYQGRNVDELVYLDVTATAEQRDPDVALVRQLTSELFAPLTVGGGVRTLDHFRQLLANGADKVCINTAAVETPEIITQAAEKFGRQAVEVSIDVKDGKVFVGCGKNPTNLNPIDWAKEVESRGAGEILLNAIDRDGTLSGYDLDLVESVSGAVGIPVVACGGAGYDEARKYLDFKLALDAGAHAVAASAMWHFTDARPREAAIWLASQGYPTRIAA